MKIALINDDGDVIQSKYNRDYRFKSRKTETVKTVFCKDFKGRDDFCRGFKEIEYLVEKGNVYSIAQRITDNFDGKGEEVWYLNLSSAGYGYLYPQKCIQKKASR